MPLQKLSVTGLDNENQRRRLPETINQILTHQFDDSRRQTDSEKVAGVTPVNPAFKPYNVLRYGADPTGATSSLSAFQKAVDACHGGTTTTVWVPNGTYLIDGEILCHHGIKFMGDGSQGSTTSIGTSIIHASNGNCFKWDGNGVSAYGTGGGIHHMLIVKQTGFSGGRAIYLLATDDNHRPTEFTFHDILIYGTGTGMWQRALEIDGTACNTAGTKGVRDIGLFKVRVASCTQANEYILINQGVHINGAYVQVDQGNGSGTCGMSISGESGPINLSAVEINGTMLIGDTSDFINIQGHIGSTFAQSGNTTCTGTIVVSGVTTFTSVSPNMRFVCNTVDAFHAFLSSTQANATGDGTAYPIPFNSERFDQDNTHSSGTATTQNAGLYEVKAYVVLNNLSAAHTGCVIEIIQKNASASTVSVASQVINPGAIRNGSNQASISASTLMKCSKSDAITVNVTVSGSTKTVGVVGDASTSYTYFTMKLLA